MKLLTSLFSHLFEMENSLLELFLRGSILYLGILILMRIMPRRTGGELATMDLVFIFLIAEAATHSVGEYSSVTEGFVVIGTLIFWNYLVNWLSFQVPFLENMISAPHLQIVKDGIMLRRNMRREFITEEELMENLRKEGIDNLADVQCAFVEGDGKISVIRKEP